jgi:hypothetical protein
MLRRGRPELLAAADAMDRVPPTRKLRHYPRQQTISPAAAVTYALGLTEGTAIRLRPNSPVCHSKVVETAPGCPSFDSKSLSYSGLSTEIATCVGVVLYRRL